MLDALSFRLPLALLGQSQPYCESINRWTKETASEGQGLVVLIVYVGLLLSHGIITESWVSSMVIRVTSVIRPMELGHIKSWFSHFFLIHYLLSLYFNFYSTFDCTPCVALVGSAQINWIRGRVPCFTELLISANQNSNQHTRKMSHIRCRVILPPEPPPLNLVLAWPSGADKRFAQSGIYMQRTDGMYLGAS